MCGSAQGLSSSSPTDQGLVFHNINSIRLKRLAGRSVAVVVDGQQRLTTTSLLLAACWHLGRQLAKADDLGGKPADCWQETEAAIKKSLFLCHADVLKLVPSLPDREAYRLAVITEKLATLNSASCAEPILAARRRFEAFLQAHVNGHSAVDALGLMGRIVCGSLDMMRPMLVELDPTVSLPAVFQQYQEKSLLGVAAFLPGIPGVSFRAADLVRNYVMADHVELALEEQEEVYRRVWLAGLEERAPPGGLDEALDIFMSTVGFPACDLEAADTGDRFVSEFETTVRKTRQIKLLMAQDELELNGESNPKVDTSASSENFRGIELYARFYSYIQHLEQDNARGKDPKGVRSLAVHIFLESFSDYLTQHCSSNSTIL